jgi:hypothetical protein
MSKLWEVEIEVEPLVVLAETEQEAERIAARNVRYGVEDAHYWASPLTAPVDPEWRKSRPYGAKDGDLRTVQQIMDEEAARPPTTEEIEAAGQQRLIA